MPSYVEEARQIRYQKISKLRVRTKPLTAMRYNYGISISRFFQGDKYADSIKLQNKLVIFCFIEVLIALNDKILSNSMTKITYSLYRM